MKNAEYYLSLNYRKTVYRNEDADWIVEVNDLPGCVADGTTPDEAFENLRHAMTSWIQSRLEAGLAIPEPRDANEYSGRILLRMPKSMHRALSLQATEEGVSLNHYLVSLLATAKSGSVFVRTVVREAPTLAYGKPGWLSSYRLLNQPCDRSLGWSADELALSGSGDTQKILLGIAPTHGRRTNEA